MLDENGEEYSEPFEVDLALSGDDGLRIDKIVSVDQWRKGDAILTPKPMPVERRASLPSQSSAPMVEHESASDQVSGARPAMAQPAIERVPTATGTLAATPLVHTLVYMLDHALGGTIELREPDGTRHELFFVRGAPTRARTGRTLAPLGALLVAAGLLRDTDAAEAVSSARLAGMRLGEYLVEKELVARVELLRALEGQVTRKIELLVNLDPATTFAFFRDVDLFGDDKSERLEVDPLGAIFAAVRTWQDRARVRKVVSAASSLLLAIHPDSTLELVDLPDEERVLLAELRANPSNMAELIARTYTSPHTLDTFLFGAIVTRQLLVPGQSKVPMGVRASSLRAPQPSPFPSHVSSMPPQVRQSQSAEPPQPVQSAPTKRPRGRGA